MAVSKRSMFVVMMCGVILILMVRGYLGKSVDGPDYVIDLRKNPPKDADEEVVFGKRLFPKERVCDEEDC